MDCNADEDLLVLAFARDSNNDKKNLNHCLKVPTKLLLLHVHTVVVPWQCGGHMFVE
jgi:hypothetical protein